MILGKLLIGGEWQLGEAGHFNAVNPATGDTLPVQYSKASAEQISAAASAANIAFASYRNTSLKDRAGFLNACADEIMALGDELLECMQSETGYPRGRCEGERGRTVGQLRMFADYIQSGDHLDPRIDMARPDRQPLPRPDLRFLNQALGVVAVFAVSNFPLAYSTAGGDSASALAAGCPVIVKGHVSHPGTGELVAQALAIAAQKTGMPGGVISFVQGDDKIGGAALINAPEVKAIGFTGSIGGGTAIYRMAALRPEPIPVFAEMGSINPVVFLPETLAQSAEQLATGFVGSLTLGSGQFCVNPGLLIALEEDGLQRFMDTVKTTLETAPAGVMLNQNICNSYQRGNGTFANHPAMELIAEGQVAVQAEGFYAQAKLYSTSAENYLANPELSEEVFGPTSVLVVCKTIDEIHQVISSLGGQLTGTVHGTENELTDNAMLLQLLGQKAGRLVINGFPTGVEVCPTMVHGGPYPASTDARFTAVGTAAIKRFVRPVCYQNFPQALLPEALQNANPLDILRTVDGEKTKTTIST
ncbi:MAG: aldehyde dehydrogenase (NADP(+)) [Robiginitomaculum sp.]|nr:MAG: aldehyde dehydrogenase (NADP(+)) [Robiginitomaculum sp.]